MTASWELEHTLSTCPSVGSGKDSAYPHRSWEASLVHPSIPANLIMSPVLHYPVAAAWYSSSTSSQR